jgi:hypothetical protein
MKTNNNNSNLTIPLSTKLHTKNPLLSKANHNKTYKTTLF